MANKSDTTTKERSGQTGKIWDRFADNYSKQPIADEAAYQKKLELTQQYFRKDMNVLEFGCGTGGTSIIHAPHVQKILATDISAKMIDIAMAKAKEAGVTNVEFQQTSMDQLELPNASQDVVLGLSILHLLKNRKEAIAKSYKLLKPGGLFISSTTCIGEMGMATKVMLKTVLPIGQAFGMLPYLGVGLTRSELKKDLTENGFRIEYEWQPKPDAALFIIAKKPEA